MSPARKKPSALGDVLAGVLKRERARGARRAGRRDPGVAARSSAQQIAAVTEPTSIAADGTLFVAVTTNAWMNELSLMEPELLRALNAKEGRPPVRRIRWLLRRVKLRRVRISRHVP